MDMAVSSTAAAVRPASLADPGSAGAEQGVRAGSWLAKGRLLPSLLAAFLAMLWLVPFDAVTLPVPLPVDSTLDRVALPVLLLVWVASLTIRAARARPRLRLTAIDTFMALLVGVSLLSLLANAQTLIFAGEFEFGVKKLAILVSVVLFFYVVASSIRPADLEGFSNALVLLGTITAVGVIYEYRTGTNVFYDWTDKLLPGSISVAPPPQDPEFGRETVSGPTEHPIAIGTMFAMALPFAFTGFFRARVTRARALHAVAIGLMIAASFATVRRTGAVGPAAALLVLLLYRPRNMVRLLPLGIVIVLSTQLLAPSAISRVKAQFLGGFFEDKSVVGRTADYDAVVPDVKKRLVLGRGYGTYDPQTYRYLDNEYLGRTIETGIVGALVYLLLILAVIRVAHRASRSHDPVRRSVGIAVAAGAFAYLVTNVVFDAFSFPQAPYVFLFIAGLAVVAASTDDSADLDARAISDEEPATPAVGPEAPPRRAVGAPEGEPTRADAGNPPDLSVIVVTHNGRERATATLRSALVGIGSVTAELFVVDSGSSDGTPDAIEAEWPGITVVRQPNIGFAAANNVALQLARGRYLLLLNPDVEIVSGTITDLIDALDERPDVGIASVNQQSSDGRPLPSIGRFPSVGRQLAEALGLPRVRAFRQLQEQEPPSPSYASERRADWLVGAFLAIRREAFADVGPFDERFFLYSEEKDFCRRAHTAGWDVRHLPVMTVVHHTGGYNSPGLAAQLTYSKMLFAHKHFGLVRSGAIRACLGLGHRLRIVAFGLRAPFSSAAAARVRNERDALRAARRRAAPFIRPRSSS